MSRQREESIVLIDPAFRPETRQIAVALSESRLPFQLYTSVYPGPRAGIVVLARLLPTYLRTRAEELFLRRYEPAIDGSRVSNSYVPDIARRIARLSGVPDYRVNIFVERVFDQILALLAGRNATVVVCVQGSALCTFRRAQRRGVKCVLIAQTPDPHVEAEIVLAEESRLGLRPQRAAARNAYAERVRQEFAHADLIMANSEFTKSDIVTNGVPETKVVVTQLGVDQDKFKARDSSRASSEPNVALFVGSVQARKGVIHFARAVDELRKKDIDIIGRAVGVVDRAYARCLQPFIESKAIQLVGPTSHHRLTSEYENADVFVFPTLSDGYGLVVLEAMACGVPVVVSNRCGAPVIDGTNALVVPHGNASALSDGIERILQDASLRETLRQGGLQTARSVSWPAYRGQVREILKGINGV